MKKLFNKIKDWFTWSLPWLCVVAGLCLSLLITYLIGASNLPDWLKWWLLK